MTQLATALYEGTVFHQRFRPKVHKLSYGVFQCLFDLDELDGLSARLKYFARNRFNLISFRDRDYADRTSVRPLRDQIEDHMRAAGVEPDGGPIRLLTMPRILGHVFNPLSVWFCHRRDGSLAVIVYEVTNTFRERHSYVIPVAEGHEGTLRQWCDKRFYVSPFMDLDMRYDFTIDPPDGSARVVITGSDPKGKMIIASFGGRRVGFNDANLLSAFLRYPLLTLKVVAGIHIEAIWLAFKGISIRRHVAAKGDGLSIVPLNAVPRNGRR